MVFVFMSLFLMTLVRGRPWTQRKFEERMQKNASSSCVFWLMEISKWLTTWLCVDGLVI
jgi:hypothetical protein